MAVWQERLSAGTPASSFTGVTSATSCTSTVKPACFTASTQLLQQPQVGDLYTVMTGKAVEADGVDGADWTARSDEAAGTAACSAFWLQAARAISAMIGTSFMVGILLHAWKDQLSLI